MSSIICNLAI